MEEAAWKALTAALAFGLAATKLAADALSARRKRQAGGVQPHLVARAAHAHLQTMVLGSDGHRAVLIKATNGDGRPREGRDVYITAMWEAVESPMGSIVGKWERVRAGSYYRELLQDLDRTGSLLLRADQLPVGSALRDTYDAAGVSFSWVSVLHRAADAFYYVSVNYTDAEHGGELEPADRDVLRTAARGLSAILEDDAQRAVLDPPG